MRLLHSTLIALASALLLQAEANYHLQNNNPVVFYGDSITDRRLYTQRQAAQPKPHTFRLIPLAWAAC
jgi:hypothetical protein